MNEGAAAMVSREIGRYFWLLFLSAVIPAGLLLAVALSTGYAAGAWSTAAATFLFLCIATPLLTFLKVRGLATWWNCILVAAVVGAIVACLDPLFAHWREAYSAATPAAPPGVAVMDRPPEGPISGFGIVILSLLYSVAGAIFWLITRQQSPTTARQGAERESALFFVGLSVLYWAVLVVLVAVLFSELLHNLFGWPAVLDLLGLRAYL